MKTRYWVYGFIIVIACISIAVYPRAVSALDAQTTISSLSSLLMTHGNCPWGYRVTDGQCQPVPVPKHAFLDSSGRYWECERGYQRTENRCMPVKVPAHAFLNYSGHDWECERGYRCVEDRCVEIQLPAHAYLDFTGNDWTCERGYQHLEGQCVPIKLPAHAHLDYFGHDWECHPGFERVDNTCQSIWALLKVPEVKALAQVVSPETRRTVKQLQHQLKQAGHDPGPIDGILGPKTLTALKQYIEAQERVLAKGWPTPSSETDGS